MEPVHIYKPRSDQEINLLINVVPVVVFVITLTVVLVIMHSNKKLAKSSDGSAVMGGYTESTK